MKQNLRNKTILILSFNFNKSTKATHWGKSLVNKWRFNNWIATYMTDSPQALPHTTRKN